MNVRKGFIHSGVANASHKCSKLYPSRLSLTFECTICPGCNEDTDCNKHGMCDKEKHQCHCEDPYTGELCETTIGTILLSRYKA